MKAAGGRHQRTQQELVGSNRTPQGRTKSAADHRTTVLKWWLPQPIIHGPSLLLQREL
jgi:hypothetical protein